jgi:hypothetical protein
MRVLIAALPLALALLGPASAQTTSTACPPASSNTGQAAKTGPGGAERPSQQPVERSAIVPNAGGHDQSAAPTVQQNGQDVIADANCPKPPNQPNAHKTN